MPRGKLTEEQKEERRRRKEEKRLQKVLAGQLEDLYYDHARTTHFGPPTREFDVDERVHYGAHDKTEILEAVEADGCKMFYLVRCWGVHGVYGKPEEYEQVQWIPWWALYKLPPDPEPEILRYEDDVHLNFYQNDVGGLLHLHYRGIDYGAEYQREHVWTPTQRVKLIDSIFNNIDTGRIAVIDRGYLKSGPMYEVLDGKQRLASLVMFSEDRFMYKGMLFSQMNRQDQNHFRMHPVSLAQASNLTRVQKLRYFLKLNTEGTPQDIDHLEHVRRLYLQAIDETGS